MTGAELPAPRVRWRRWLMVVGSLALAGSAFWVLRPHPSASAPPVADTPLISVAVVRAGRVSAVSTQIGEVLSSAEVAVTAPMAASVSTIPVTVGESVPAGHTVATLANPSLTAALANAETALAFARSASSPAAVAAANARQALAFVQSSQSPEAVAAAHAAQAVTVDRQALATAVSGGDAAEVSAAEAALATAEGTLAQAQAAWQAAIGQAEAALASADSAETAAVANAESILRQAAANVAQLTLTAPLAGTVTAVNVVPGQNVAPGVPLLTLTGPDQIVQAAMPPAVARYLHREQRLWVTGPGWRRTATVDTIVPGTTTPLALVTLTLAPGAALLLGQLTSVAVPLPSTAGMIVPLAAVIAGSGHATVDVVRQGRVWPTGVRLLNQNGVEAAISSLPAGTIVAVPANGNFFPGESVRVTTAPR